MVILCVVWELSLDKKLVFIVEAASRNTAKSLVQRYGRDHGLSLSSHVATHVIQGPFVRVDALL